MTLAFSKPVAVGGEDFTQRGGSPTPAGLRKSGAGLDLPIAVGILAYTFLRALSGRACRRKVGVTLWILSAIFASERHLIGRIPLPIGVSLLVLARKPAAS
jgi:hypothetical protein